MIDIRKHVKRATYYSANWDHYQTDKIGFWSELDYIGMTSYYKLAKKANPDITEVNSNWKRIKKEILEFQRDVGKPILFTEVGWCAPPTARIRSQTSRSTTPDFASHERYHASASLPSFPTAKTDAG